MNKILFAIVLLALIAIAYQGVSAYEPNPYIATINNNELVVKDCAAPFGPREICEAVGRFVYPGILTDEFIWLYSGQSEDGCRLLRLVDWYRPYFGTVVIEEITIHYGIQYRSVIGLPMTYFPTMWYKVYFPVISR